MRTKHGEVGMHGWTAVGEIKAWREISATEPMDSVREDIADEVIPELRDVLSSLPYVADVVIKPVELTDADIN
ncbi:hypothetical protein ACOZ4L_16695 (plasmid) [Haloplanus ruber]|uniref:Uncharacterized protein n=1 Tax=Haloplanus ruber TaxID=869892 RepID=A0ABD6D513_9EURY|nr:hypothetical protein [Haloplanus ruber]